MSRNVLQVTGNSDESLDIVLQVVHSFIGRHACYDEFVCCRLPTLVSLLCPEHSRSQSIIKQLDATARPRDASSTYETRSFAHPIWAP